MAPLPTEGLESFTANHKDHPSRRGHRTIDGLVLWELRYLYHALYNAGLRVKHWTWTQRSLKRLIQSGLVHDAEVREAAKNEDVSHLCLPTVSTKALFITLAFTIFDRNQKLPPAVVKRALGLLLSVAAACSQVVTTIASVKADDVCIEVRQCGRICGLDALMSQDTLLDEAWTSLETEPWLGTVVNGSPTEATLRDLLIFVLYISSNMVPMPDVASRVVKQKITSLCWKLLALCGVLWEVYIFTIFAAEHNLNESPPLLRLVGSRVAAGLDDGANNSDADDAMHPPTSRKKRPMRVDPEAPWAVIQRARELHGVTARNVLLIKADEAPLMSLAGRNADTWMHYETNLYIELCRENTGNCCHYNVVADPSIHGGKQTMLCALWCWEANVGCVPLLQYPGSAIFVDPDEVNILYEFQEKARQDDLTRKDAYFEQQSILHAIKQATNRDPEFFKQPIGVTSRPPRRHEGRRLVVDPNDSTRRIAYYIDEDNEESETCIRLMPEGFESLQWNLLSTGLDRGMVGAAGLYAFENIVDEAERYYCFFGYFDKYHEVIRNISNSARWAAFGVYYQMKLWTAFIWSFNYRPFGKGQWEHEKRAMLERFFRSTDHTSPVFRKWAPKLAKALRKPLICNDDYKRLYNLIPHLPSFCTKGPLTKLMRWFSWNDQCEFHIAEEAALLAGRNRFSRFSKTEKFSLSINKNFI